MLSRRPDLFGGEPLAVELHHYRPIAERAPLVHAAAAGRRRDLALVGEFHLPPRGELQIVDPVEGARREHTDGRARRQPPPDGQVHPRVVDGEAADAVVGEHLVGHPGDVAPKAAALGFFVQRARLHRYLVRADALPVGGDR